MLFGLSWYTCPISLYYLRYYVDYKLNGDIFIGFLGIIERMIGNDFFSYSLNEVVFMYLCITAGTQCADNKLTPRQLGTCKMQFYLAAMRSFVRLVCLRPVDLVVFPPSRCMPISYAGVRLRYGKSKLKH